MARKVAKGVDRTGGSLILLIGVFKLVKAALLIGVGVFGLVAAPSEMVHRIRHVLAWLGLSPGHHGFSQLLGKLGSFDHDTARKLAAASLCYGVVFVVEGVGLLYRRRWAEWLTVIVTASFIPLEIYELAERFSAGKIVTLIVNLAIVVYLVARRVAERRSVGYRLRHALG
jgi:uncharacterized membrane protein (DUF2068 family)